MSGLNTSLLIGMQALDATQAALDATSNNISNANTPGYTREVPQFSENEESVSGDQVSGGGVTLQGLQSVRDELINLQIQQQTSLQSSADTQSSVLQPIQNSFSTNSGSDIASELTAFNTSLTQLSVNPTDGSLREAVLVAGQNLAKAFNTTSNSLSSAQTAANGKVTDSVAQINTLTTQIASLNGQVAQLAATGKDGGTVQDQRDELVQQLSTLTGIQITQSSDGETITTGSGTPLVMGKQSFTLQTAANASGNQAVLDSNGTDITSTVQGGTLGGAIAVRDQTIAGLSTQLNTLATQLSSAFNTAQAKGYNVYRAPGSDFFSIPAGSTNPAADLTVSVTDPSLVAISSDGGPGSNGNLANLTGALTGNLASGTTAAATYASLVFQVGNSASNASAQSTAIGLNLTQLTDQQSSVSAVSTNEEAANLLRYQTAYEAAARIISTIQELSTVTLNMGTSGGY